MNTSNDFPLNVLTNAYILHDFTEIAYIVCTGAIPASADNAGTVADINSPKHILARLKNAEKQFRQASIFVALDEEKLELFTFYKKVDVVNDQRTILSKFGQVCRVNCCIIAQKNAARVLDLLKPENARVYRLFTSAILSSIQLTPQRGKPVAIGPRLYLMPTAPQPTDELSSPSSVQILWYLHTVNVQIVPSGQLILTVFKTGSTSLTLLGDGLDADEQFFPSRSSDTALYLAPLGHVARYKPGWRGSASSFDGLTKYLKDRNGNVDKWRQIWIRETTQWLKLNGLSDDQLQNDSLWVEAEIPVMVQKEPGPDLNRGVLWKSILWPLQLSFVVNRPECDDTSTQNLLSENSPLTSALEWFSTLEARETNNSKAQDPEKDYSTNRNDEHLFDEDLHFGSAENFAPFTAPTFPASQMVYPTPPDVAMTHHTPGFLSVDGLAPTPAAMPIMSQDKQQGSPRSEMDDVIDSPSMNRPGAGYSEQDEDLFEEMPGDGFGEAGGGDEPNWDFFDGPGFDLENPSTKQPHVPHKSSFSPADPLSKITAEGQRSNSQGSPVSSQSHAGAAVEQFSTSQSPKPFARDEILPEKPSRGEGGRTLPELRNVEGDGKTKDVSEKENFDQVGGIISSKRRSSVYDGLSTKPRNEDDKYSADGKYWFEFLPHNVHSALLEPRFPPRPPSSSSDTTMTSDSYSNSEVGESELNHKHGHKWTEYYSSPLPDESEMAIDFNEAEVVHDTTELLTVFEKNPGEIFTPSSFHYPHRPSGQAKTAHRVSMIAQLLAEQISQSSLFDTQSSIPNDGHDDLLQFEVSVNNAGSNTVLTNASVAELMSIQPTPVANKPSSKVSALRSCKVRTRRFDGEITAESTILHYWDTLNLHPLSGSKNAKAFLIHPRGDNLLESCSNFLQQIGESYGNCNLGVHDTGRIDGVTENGLLCWNSSDNQDSNLSQICQNLGTALATSDYSGETIIIYMVVSGDHLHKCVELCDAFIDLFESFLKAKQSKDGDVALQLIPSSFLIAPDTLVVPSQDQYNRLSIEVYNRLPPRTANAQPASSGSATCLAKQRSANLSFELSTKTTSPFSKEGDCLHVAFCYSADKRWMTATWTDMTGEVALSMSYCLQLTVESPARPRLDVFRDISDVSQQLMAKHQSKWWLAVAKVGFYERDEIQEWLYLATQMTENHKALGRVVLVSVEIQPRISLQPFEIPLRHNIHQIQSAGNPFSTPVSTPQASMTSPDHVIPTTPVSGGAPSTIAQTPPEQGIDSFADADVQLFDELEESWMVTLAFGLNQSRNFLDVWPALASGFLLKRSAIAKHDRSGLASLGVNLVATPRAPALSHIERESLLQEVISQYRGLVTLAFTRGCIDYRKECVPWHVATVVKSANVLGTVM